jgi:hypothetical protein
MRTKRNAARLIESKRHLLSTIVAQPIKLNPAQAPAGAAIVAHITTAVETAVSFHAKELSAMEVEKGRGAFRVGAFRHHGRLLVREFSSDYFPVPVEMQAHPEEI